MAVASDPIAATAEFEFGLSPPGDVHTRAFGCEALCGRKSDPASAPCNYSDLAIQSTHARSPLSFGGGRPSAAVA